jgi:hypothetical protein
MRVSIITDDKVMPDKKLVCNEVTDVFEIETLEELIYLCLNAHIAPATFINNRKALSHLEQIQFICLDFDNGTHSVDVHNKLLNYTHVILASKNHMVDKGDGKGIIERFHVFIPLTEPIKANAVYKYACEYVCKKHQFQSDKSVIEASRYFYRHKELLYHHTATLLNTSILLTFYQLDELYKQKCQEKRQRQQSQQTQYKRHTGIYDNLPSIEKFKHTKYFRDMENGVLRCDGSRYAESSRVLGGMIACGVDFSEAMSLFDEFASYGEHFTRASVERRYLAWR